MEENLIKRVLPHSVEAEKSVIGSMLMAREAITVAMEVLHTEDFYQQQYGVMFETIAELFNEGKPTDLVTVLDRLKKKSVPEELCSLDFLRDLLNTVPFSSNVRSYAQIVYEKALLRRLIKLSEEIAGNCYVGKDSVEDILEDTEKRMFELLQKRSTTDYVPIQDVVLEVVDNIERAARNKGAVTGIPTGFTDLDNRTCGMQPADLVLIAARPSMGKTAFVLNMAEYMAIRNQYTTAIFSLEMSKEQLVNRLLAMHSHVDSQSLRTGHLSERDWESIVDSSGVIAGSKLIIDDTPGISVGEMRSKCRKYKLEHNLKCVIIDYIQLMSGSSTRKNDSRQQEVSDISRSLKQMARELGVPVIALSQLSRACEARQDHRPMLSDLRESGAIEQDADVVMFLYRDEYYNKDTEDKGVAEVIIAKQRNGPIGTVKLLWIGELTKFANMEYQRE
ncbi:MAG: replicative DNA helicase [Lachnospiraceae bacterium]|nr:replicative DNA helicase [Lachnospiraceae bacterium]